MKKLFLLLSVITCYVSTTTTKNKFSFTGMVTDKNVEPQTEKIESQAIAIESCFNRWQRYSICEIWRGY